MDTSTRRPSPALIVALIALVAAVAGTATALPGKNKVDKNDIKKNAVKSKQIKNAQVKSVDVKDAEIGAADLTPDENFHRIGDPGEPAFGNGGENDCIWSNVGTLEAGPGATGNSLNPAAFYRDKSGRVHLAGVIQAIDGPGGDGACDDAQDSRAFVLPAGYQPENLELHPVNTDATGDSIILTILSEQPVAAGGVSIAAGTVIASVPGGETQVSLDGVSFRAASPGGAGIASAAANATPPTRGTLRQLGVDPAALGLEDR
jgi:hypothetical protein